MITTTTLLLIAGATLLASATIETLTNFTSSSSSSDNSESSTTTSYSHSYDTTNSEPVKQRKSIGSFSFHEIKYALEVELMGESTCNLEYILRQNNFYNEEQRERIANSGRYEVARELAQTAQYGNRIYPSYLSDRVEDFLNDRYNK